MPNSRWLCFRWRGATKPYPSLQRVKINVSSFHYPYYSRTSVFLFDSDPNPNLNPNLRLHVEPRVKIEWKVFDQIQFLSNVFAGQFLTIILGPNFIVTERFKIVWSTRTLVLRLSPTSSMWCNFSVKLPDYYVSGTIIIRTLKHLATTSGVHSNFKVLISGSISKKWYFILNWIIYIKFAFSQFKILLKH